MLYEIVLGIISVIGLLVGAELVIHNARKIAHKLKISDFFIGLTIFSIGTSLPEIATHVISSVDILRGVDYTTLSGLAVGTNIGSNIIQISLITGFIAFFGVLKAKRKFLKIDYPMMLGSIALLFFFSLDKVISRLEGIILIVLYAGYLFYLVKDEKVPKKLIRNHLKEHDKFELYIAGIIMLGGLIMLLLSADRIADLTIFFSEKFLIAGSLLGTLIVGVSTALPEFTTSVFALRKKNAGMSLGTLVGSNITNPLLALGIGAVISTYAVENSTLWFDLPFWFFVSIIPLAVMWRKQILTKSAGAILIAAYIAFIVLRLYLF